jgi:hypothetical protein
MLNALNFSCHVRINEIPRMIVAAENYWAYELYSSSGILKTRELSVSMFPSSGEKADTLLGPLDRAHRRLLDWKQTQFPKRCVF